MDTFNKNDIKYLEAKKQVKKIKGFYTHLMVYVLVNLFIFGVNFYKGKFTFDNMDNFWLPVFWGIGLLAHGLSVFLPQFAFGKDWEEKKIRELMDQQKRNK